MSAVVVRSHKKWRVSPLARMGDEGEVRLAYEESFKDWERDYVANQPFDMIVRDVKVAVGTFDYK